MSAPTPIEQTQQEGHKYDPDDIKAAEKFIDFLKAEADRMTSKSRLYEDRSKTYATLAAAGGAVATLIKPDKFTPFLTLLLIAVGALTLGLIAMVVAVNWGRKGVATTDSWLRKKQEDIRAGKDSYMDTLHQIQTSYIGIISSLHEVNDSKTKALERTERMMIAQLTAVVVFVLARILS